jgi:homogentisate 1,2-dioxygenase
MGHDAGAMGPEAIHARDGIARLAERLAALGTRRLLVLCSPSRRFVDRVIEGLGGAFACAVFDGARVHVPAEVVEAAERALAEARADTVLAVGGGSAIGLGKALRLRHDLRFAVVPTTYCGSEVTSIWGLTRGQEKTTGRDPRVRPDVVLYDAGLTAGLPIGLTVQSLMNALAHPVSALSTGSLAGEARAEAVATVAALVRVMEDLLLAPRDPNAREAALRAAAAGALAIERGKGGQQHAAAHYLGGALGLEHAALHSLLLPQFLVLLRARQPDLVAELERATDGQGLEGQLHDLLTRAGAPTSLEALGVDEAVTRRLLDARPDLPAEMVLGAQRGLRPSAARPEPAPPPLALRAAAGGWGFGNTLESEALAGALPRQQNSPRRTPFGLYAEQVNGSGFTAHRSDNRRTWLYRIRPSSQRRPFAPLAHERFGAAFAGRPPEINLTGWAPLPLPAEPRDFIDGLVTVAGAGAPGLRRGCAIHLYCANRDMDRRAFYDADGDLLLVPEQGALTVLTELGPLLVAPGQIALLPRGLLFSVRLQGPIARGYLAESFGRAFQLPERGPVGANGLADARHFQAPAAWYEDRLAPDFRVVAKLGGGLHQASCDHSPFDVVAWHGNHLPFRYDLGDFSPVGSVRFDHPDPSIYTVVSAPLDEAGAHTLDLIVFPPRWEVSAGTFRPPFFHRNPVSEVNGIIREPAAAGSPFVPGCCFITPALTAHGPGTRAVDRARTQPDGEADRPQPPSTDSLWFQLETILPLSLTPWAEEHRLPGWPATWGSHRSRFTPGER